MSRHRGIAQQEGASVAAMRKMAQEAEDRHVAVGSDVADMEMRCVARRVGTRIRRSLIADETRRVQPVSTDERGIRHVQPFQRGQIAAPEIATIGVARDQTGEDLAGVLRIAFLDQQDRASESDARAVGITRRGPREQVEPCMSFVEVEARDARFGCFEIQA
ncbi:MAG TPA: hypothetical protein VJ696_02100 [Rhodanobacteraceae bacterium]|nr:hypothetical protein [Rhodanobacteraceae bacterium]